MELSYLIRTGRMAVCHGLRNAWVRCSSLGHSHPYEPDFVASLVVDGLPFLAWWWQGILGPIGWSLNVLGVFCHNSPKVEFNQQGSGSSKSKVELGDLLIAHVHKDTRGNVSRYALLLQACKWRSKRRPSPPGLSRPQRSKTASGRRSCS